MPLLLWLSCQIRTGETRKVPPKVTWIACQPLKRIWEKLRQRETKREDNVYTASLVLLWPCLPAETDLLALRRRRGVGDTTG